MSKAVFIDIDGIRYNFYCRSESTRNGFKHVVQLFENGIITATAQCFYLNRTWECWIYQSCCIEAINKRIQEIRQNELLSFKACHNYNRMTARRQMDFDSLMNENSVIQSLNKVKKALYDNLY